MFRSLASSLLLLCLSTSVRAAADITPVTTSWSLSDSVPIECLNRTIDTGEHIISDLTGRLQYIPFFTCATIPSSSASPAGAPAPFFFPFGISTTLNCTLPSISDPTFHLLELYLHNDAPLTCRLPARPFGHETQLAQKGEDDGLHVPFTVALAGKLEPSHLHIKTTLNAIIHHTSEGEIVAGAAYSVPEGEGRRLVIGEELPLTWRVRWYEDLLELPRQSEIRGEGVIGWGMLSFGVMLAMAVGMGLGVVAAGGDVDAVVRRVRRVVGGRTRGGQGGGIMPSYRDKGGYGGGNGNGGYGIPMGSGGKRVD